jgi:hypothetical protein
VLAAMTTYPTGARPYGLAVADLNGDGLPDVVVTNQMDNTVGILLGLGGGAFAAQTTYAVGTGPTGVVIADFDRDGLLDIAIANTGATTVAILFARCGP